MMVEERLSFVIMVTVLGIITMTIVYKVITMSMDEGLYKQMPKDPPEVGGYVRYSNNNIDYQELNDTDKMNFAFQIMPYNVHDKKEIPEGAAEVRNVRKVEDLFRVESPKVVVSRFSTMLVFLSFGLFLVVLVAWLGGIVLGINPEKRDVLRITVFLLLGLFGMSYLIDWIRQRAMDKLDAIQTSL